MKTHLGILSTFAAAGVAASALLTPRTAQADPQDPDFYMDDTTLHMHLPTVYSSSIFFPAIYNGVPLIGSSLDVFYNFPLQALQTTVLADASPYANLIGATETVVLKNGSTTYSATYTGLKIGYNLDDPSHPTYDETDYLSFGEVTPNGPVQFLFNVSTDGYGLRGGPSGQNLFDAIGNYPNEPHPTSLRIYDIPNAGLGVANFVEAETVPEPSTAACLGIGGILCTAVSAARRSKKSLQAFALAKATLEN